MTHTDALLQFVTEDPRTITQDMIAAWEAETGKTLYPAQLDRLLVDAVAYREVLVRAAINDTARQNLLAYARGPMLDYLGELMGVIRLPAQCAATTMRLHFAQPLAATLTIVKDWRIATTAGVLFASATNTIAIAGTHSVDFVAIAERAGSDSNGYLPGQVAIAVDTLPVAIAKVENLGTTSGGAEAETDERLRVRIRQAPEEYSYGSAGRYRAQAMRAAADLVDVQIFSPRPDGSVVVVLLGQNGVPSAETMQRVHEALTAPDVRMLGDRITVQSAQPYDYALAIELDLLSDRIPERVLALARERLEAFTSTLAAKLGAALVPAQFKLALSGLDGLFDVRIASPADKVRLPIHQWPRCTDIRVTLGSQRA